MATAKQLSSAINNRNVPIDVIPDYRAGGANYGQELINQQPAGTYKYGSGPSTYLSVAPGTKTLASRQFDEDKRAKAVSEDLAERSFQEDVRARKVAEALSARKAASSGSGGGLTDKERFAAIQSGALSHVKELMNPQPTGVVSGNDAGIFLGTHGQQMGYGGGMSPEKAAEQTVKLVQEQLGDMGITKTDYENLVKMIYYSVGLEPPSKTAKEEDDLSEVEKLLGLGGINK